MNFLQAAGIGFGLAMGFAAACIAFVMCGAAASASKADQTQATIPASAQAQAPSVDPEPEAEPAPALAGWVLFDGTNMALCKTMTLKDRSEETFAAAKERMVGWTPLPVGSSCNTLGGQARATCTGPLFQTTAFHYIGATASGHLESMRKSCIQAGNTFKALF